MNKGFHAIFSSGDNGRAYADGRRAMPSPDIDGGSIDGAVIGGTTPAAGSFATLSVAGALTAANASNAIVIGPSCTMSSPPAIGGVAPASGAFTTLSATGVITSSLATGTAPFSVASTTVVPNLNVSQLLGATWGAPSTIGSSTPNTGAFTTLSASTSVSTNTVALLSGLAASIFAGASSLTLGASGSTLDIGSSLRLQGGGDNIIQAFGGRNLTLRLGSTGGANVLSIRDAAFTQQASVSDVGVFTMKGMTLNGSGTLGSTSTDTITCTGRLILRQVTDAGPMTTTAGTKGEPVYNLSDNKAYICTATGSPATWAAMN